MAQIVLGVVGAVIGGYFGGPQGAAAGWAIGSSIGAAIDTPNTFQTGPRLSELNVQYSTWGAMIPELYGTQRMTGNVIWSTPIKETTNTTSESAKGGPSVETTTFSYSVDVAIGLCRGEISGIRRIWANGTLIYNIGPTADINTVLSSQGFSDSFRVYNGTEDQFPDPTIEGSRGVGNTTAYRGLAYVVFGNLQLANYGNRIPNFEFEVVKSGSDQFQYFEFYGPTTNFNSWLGLSTPFYEVGRDIISAQAQFHVGSAYTLDFYQLQTESESGIFLNRVAIPGDVPTPHIMIGTADEPGALIFPFANATVCYWITQTELLYIPIPGALVPTDVGLYLGQYVKVGDQLFILQQVWNPTGGAIINSRVTKWNTRGEGNVGDTGLLGKAGIAWMAVSNGIIYLARSVTVPNSVIEITRIDVASMNVISTDIYTNNFSSSIASIFVNSNNQIFVSSGISIYQLKDGVVNEYSFSQTNLYGFVIGGADGKTAIGSSLFSGRGSQSVAPQVSTYSYNALTPDQITLADVVEDLCAKAGVDEVDLNTTELLDAVDGYCIKQQSSARGNIYQLQIAYFFDAVESEFQIKFPKRGGAPVADIQYFELGAIEGSDDVTEPLQIIRAQEVDLPRRVTVKYINLHSDYLIGSEAAQRLITESKQEMTQELALTLTPDKAAQIADVLLYDAHMGRTKFSTSLTKKWDILDPTDVVRIHAPDQIYVVRLTAANLDGPVKNFEGVMDDPTVYDSNAVGGSVQPPQEQITVVGPTRAEYLDIPIVRDSDDNSGFYVPMTGFRDQWRGATLFKAIDNLSFIGIGTVLNNATIGNAITKLGNYTGANFLDEINSVNVQIIRNELVSISYEELLSGGNCILLGNELVQFMEAELIGDRQYRLSSLLRGRCGTEQWKDSHAASERAVLMTVAGTLRPDGGTSEIGQVRYYKPVSIQQRETEVVSREFTNHAVGLMPYSPVHLGGGQQVNGDFFISWQRRTRIDGGWRNNVDVPLGEAIEAYQIEILNGATVLRTLDSSVQSVTYTEAEVIEDFGSMPVSIDVVIYQMSATVGRGFPAKKTYFSV